MYIESVAVEMNNELFWAWMDSVRYAVWARTKKTVDEDTAATWCGNAWNKIKLDGWKPSHVEIELERYAKGAGDVADFMTILPCY
jgi:hypothetical protein